MKTIYTFSTTLATLALGVNLLMDKGDNNVNTDNTFNNSNPIVQVDNNSSEATTTITSDTNDNQVAADDTNDTEQLDYFQPYDYLYMPSTNVSSIRDGYYLVSGGNTLAAVQITDGYTTDEFRLKNISAEQWTVSQQQMEDFVYWLREVSPSGYNQNSLENNFKIFIKK